MSKRSGMEDQKLRVDVSLEIKAKYDLGKMQQTEHSSNAIIHGPYYIRRETGTL